MREKRNGAADCSGKRGACIRVGRDIPAKNLIYSVGKVWILRSKGRGVMPRKRVRRFLFKNGEKGDFTMIAFFVALSMGTVKGGKSANHSFPKARPAGGITEKREGGKRTASS